MIQRFAALLLLIVPATSQAALITFTHAATGNFTGTLNGIGFSTTGFTITAMGDTANRVTIGGIGYFTSHDSATISINGLGTYAFVTPTRTFINDVSDVVGFSRVSGADLLNGPTSAVFNGWDMLTSIGPVTGGGNVLQWSISFMPQVNTSGGVLAINGASATITYQAVVNQSAAVPEPATLTIFGVGVLGFAGAALRRRRRAAS